MLKRSPNWSYEESEQLIVSVDLRKQILFSKDNGLTTAVKVKSWEEVAREVSSVGYGRCIREVKKKWSQMKLIAKGKAANLLSETTGEVSWQESLKDLDSSVTRILGIIEQFDKTDSSGSGEGLASGTESTDVLLKSEESSFTDECTKVAMSVDETVVPNKSVPESNSERKPRFLLITPKRKKPLDLSFLNKAKSNPDLQILINLQEQTLDAVNQLVQLQSEILKVEQERLAVEQERLTVEKNRLSVMESKSSMHVVESGTEN